VTWLLFMDESGHDHKNMPLEVRGGVALHVSRLWDFAVFARTPIAFRSALEHRTLIRRHDFPPPRCRALSARTVSEIAGEVDREARRRGKCFSARTLPLRLAKGLGTSPAIFPAVQRKGFSSAGEERPML
jgi:hypothetical protein